MEVDFIPVANTLTWIIHRTLRFALSRSTGVPLGLSGIVIIEVSRRFTHKSRSRHAGRDWDGRHDLLHLVV